MNPIPPSLSGCPEVVLAEHQPEYEALPVAILPRDDDRKVMISRWAPTSEERDRIAHGEDVYVAQFIPQGALFMPMRVDCGPDAWYEAADTYKRGLSKQ